MAPRTPKIRLLRDKRRALDDLIVKAEAELAKLREEAKDFEIAERVLLSLGGDDEDESGEVIPSIVSESIAQRDAPIASKPVITEVSGKPSGTPSTPEMIIEALKTGVNQLTPGGPLSPHQILDFIKGKWWPEAQPNDINPVAWRMAKEGRLLKVEGSNYALPKVTIVPGAVRRFPSK